MELYTEVTFWERTEGTRRRVARRRVRDMVADEGVMKEREKVVFSTTPFVSCPVTRPFMPLTPSENRKRDVEFS